MSKASKILEKMQANPRDWRIDRLKTVAEAHGLIWRQPSGSHVIFRHKNGQKLSVPAHKPVKPVYVRKFTRLIEEGVGE